MSICLGVTNQPDQLSQAKKLHIKSLSDVYISVQIHQVYNNFISAIKTSPS